MKVSALLGVTTLIVSLEAFSTQVSAQMLKDIVDAAPKEDPAPMPHINQDDPSQMNIKQDKSTNIWRDLREGTGSRGEAGPIDIQR